MLLKGAQTYSKNIPKLFKNVLFKMLLKCYKKNTQIKQPKKTKQNKSYSQSIPKNKVFPKYSKITQQY